MTKIARAHTNIALIKYWGKENADLRLPLMSSLSMTLDKFYTDTSIKAGDRNRFILNNQEQTEAMSQRVFNYLERLKNRFQLTDSTPLVVDSHNHVPTAAGLASSSSAFAALALAFVSHYHLQVNSQELSRLARLGSGSASRSIFGGFAIWHRGHDDQSSYAEAIQTKPKMDLQLLAVELNTKPKQLGSTQGMQAAQTSPLFSAWLQRNSIELAAMESAIQTADFTRLGELAELNANEMHAMNLTAQPSFTYFAPETITAFKLVHQLRHEGIECYYTLDAGPNPKILCRLRNSKEIIRRFKTLFPHVKIIQASFGPAAQLLAQKDQ
jgi:diphosphomevalonate decarboxylase